MTEIKIFDVAGHRIRFGVADDGRPYSVAADYAKAMRYAKTQNATDLLDEDEKGHAIIVTPGGPQRLAVIFEDGMWELIFRSTLPGAKTIKKRVKAILREIRETGSFGATPQRELSRKELARYWYEAEERAELAEQRAAELEAPAEAWNVLASADPDYSVREAAYILNRDPAIDTGQNRLFNDLRRMRVIDSRDIPYSDHARHVKLRPRSFTNRATGEETAAKPQVRITAEGLAYLHRKLGGTAPLRLDEQLATGGA